MKSEKKKELRYWVGTIAGSRLGLGVELGWDWGEKVGFEGDKGGDWVVGFE